MKKKRIKIVLIVVAIFIMIIAAISKCQAVEKIQMPKTEKDVYVYDEDNIIEDATEKQINALLVQLEKKTEVEFAVISVDSLLDLTIEDYAYDLFNELGIGKQEDDNGILLLVSKNDTKVRLEIGKGLEGCLNDAKCGRILDNYFVPYREKNEYSKAVELTVKATMSILAKEYDVVFDEINAEEYRTEEEQSTDISVLIIIILLLILYLALGGYGGYSGGSSGGFSSGGFSGGGFGGGSSGGGGASR